METKWNKFKKFVNENDIFTTKAIFNYKGTDIMVVSINGEGVNYITNFRSGPAPESLLTWKK